MATPFDYNGDGFSDVFWVNGVTGQNIIWNMVNDTFNSQQVPAGITVPDNAISISGDFNGNGTTDVSDTVRRELASLLDHHSRAGIFLEQPVASALPVLRTVMV